MVALCSGLKAVHVFDLALRLDKFPARLRSKPTGTGTATGTGTGQKLWLHIICLNCPMADDARQRL